MNPFAKPSSPPKRRKDETPAQEKKRLRAEINKSRARKQQRQMASYVVILVALVGLYWYANRDWKPSRAALEASEREETLAAVADEMVRNTEEKSVVVQVDESEDRRLSRQRSVVAELTRRHIGSEPRGGSLDDLRLLQKVLDDRVLGTSDVYELQCLGVALGDVMERQLGLRWITVDDEYGRTRALQFGDGEDVFFPITMISKRYERNFPVDVQELYDEVASTVGKLSARALTTSR